MVLVLLVFRLRTPFKVRYAVVASVLVDVIHERLASRVRNEDRADELMNEELLMYLRLAKPYDAIPFQVVLFQRSLFPTKAVRGIAFRKRLYIAQVANRVQSFKPRYFFPSFHKAKSMRAG